MRGGEKNNKKEVVLEHGPRMQLCENSCEENPKKTRQEPCDLSFFKTQNCSWGVIVCFSQVCGIGVDLLQLLFWLCLYVMFWVFLASPRD